MSSVVLIEGWLTGGDAGIRLFHYENRIYFLLFGAALCDVLAVNAGTIAYQSDTGGFVALISFIAFVYAFFADILIFHESFSWVEMLAAIVIVFVTVTTSIYKVKEQQAEKEKLA